MAQIAASTGLGHRSATGYSYDANDSRNKENLAGEPDVVSRAARRRRGSCGGFAGFSPDGVPGQIR